MKDDTRQAYEEDVHKSKKSLMQVADLAAKAAVLDTEWQPLWQKLERVQTLLSMPTCDTIETANILRPAMRSVNRLIGMLTGTTPEDVIAQEEEAIAALPVNSRQATIIELLQGCEQALLQSCEMMIAAHPALEQLPLVQEWKMMASKIKMFPREVAKIRGLG